MWVLLELHMPAMTLVALVGEQLHTWWQWRHCSELLSLVAVCDRGLVEAGPVLE
jgi:DNA-binding transcriptional regulator of glucitol operon